MHKRMGLKVVADYGRKSLRKGVVSVEGDLL